MLPPDKQTVAVLPAAFAWSSNSISRLANALATSCGVSKDFTFGAMIGLDNIDIKGSECVESSGEGAVATS